MALVLACEAQENQSAAKRINDRKQRDDYENDRAREQSKDMQQYHPRE
jgi:hypothetical protein